MDIKHKVGIKESSKKVFEALSTVEGISQWWTRDTRGDNHEGGKIYFSFQKRLDKSFDVVAEIKELSPSKRICWKILEGPKEWLETEISFDLIPSEEETTVHFSHQNWSVLTDFMAQCNTKWAVFLLSLKSLLETGKGSPFPDDVRIGHFGA